MHAIFKSNHHPQERAVSSLIKCTQNIASDTPALTPVQAAIDEGMARRAQAAMLAAFTACHHISVLTGRDTVVQK
jgi:hypothetical protein